jgi:hypothetical protein
MSFASAYYKTHNDRFRKTLAFVEKHISKDEKILDLGIQNPLSEILIKEGFQVINTQGEDLDMDFESVKENSADVLTAFEIFEHLLSPFNVIKATNAKKLIATVPLRLWFAPSYQNKNDNRDRHFHEFEDWQFDWLLNKAGWVIKDTEKWVSPTKITGIRPLLRNFTPRHYAVYAIRP